MTINGVDISTLGARQHRVEFGHQDIRFSNEWGIGATLPFMGVYSAGFKQMMITLVIKGETRSTILAARSAILGMLTKPVILNLDGNSHHFYGVLKNHKETEIIQRRWHNMDLTFDCYEYGENVVASGNTSFSVNNPGTAVSPCIVKIVPGASYTSIELGGICRNPITGEDMPVTIPDVSLGSDIILDGITGLITEASALKDVDMWELPSLKPGATTITCNKSLMTITVTVRPIYI